MDSSDSSCFYCNLSKTFINDGIVINRFTKTFSIDGLIKQLALTKTFSNDGILKATSTKTFTTDSLITYRGTKTFSSDAIIKGTLIKTFSVDGVLKQVLVKSYLTNSIIVSRLTKTSIIDAILKITATKSFATNSILKAILTKTFTIDSLLKTTITKNYTVDAIISGAPNLKTFITDALIIQYTNYGSIFLYDSVIYEGNPFLETTMRAISGTAYARLFDLTATSPIANSILQTSSSTLTLLRASKPLILINGNQYCIQYGSIGQGAFTGAKLILIPTKINAKNFTVDVWLFQTGLTKTFSADSLIQTVKAKTFTIDAILT